MKPILIKNSVKQVFGAVLVVFFMAFITQSCKKDKDEVVVPEALRLNKNQLEFELEDSETLTITSGGTSASWQSTDPSVVTVTSDGLVTAVGYGSANIVATSGEKTATCTVEVALSELNLDKASVTLRVSQGVLLTPTTEIGYSKVTWESTDPSIATVLEDGVVSAHKGGAVTINATVAGVTTTCEITVVPDIYAIGSVEGVSTCWKNGSVVYTADGVGSSAYYDLQVVDGDVYIAGYDIDTYGAQYWKNGTLVNLTGIDDFAVAQGIHVVDGDVYVAGFEDKGSGNLATYWKNGVAVNLTDGIHEASARAIQVVDGDVYVAGYVRDGNSIAVYWKNGVAVNLTDGSFPASVYGMQVVDGDVYVAGAEYNGTTYVAKYWKNGTAINLTDGVNNARATGIQVVEDDVYVSGYEGNVAKYWINGVAVNLTDGMNNIREVTGIQVLGGDVYVSSTEGDGISRITKYWKNGVELIMSDPVSDTYVTDIFIW